MTSHRPSHARADLLFATYVELGPEDRSLQQLQAHLTTLGVEISLATLKRYSSRDEWQRRAAEADLEIAERQRSTAIDQVVSMLDRHVQLSRALQGAAGSGLQRLLADPSRISNLKEADIVRLLDLGFRTERQAVGVVSDRREIMLSLANLLTTRIVELFREVNEEIEPERRTSLFATGLDRLVDLFLTPGGNQ